MRLPLLVRSLAPFIEARGMCAAGIYFAERYLEVSMATAIPNIVNSLTGSTLDIQKLATDLVAASRAPQQAAIDAKLTKANAVISSVGRIVSAASTMKQYLTNQHGDPKALAYVPLGDNSTNTTFTFHPSSPARSVDFSFQINQVATMNSVTLPGMRDADLTDRTLDIYESVDPAAEPAFTINLSGKTMSDVQAEIKDKIGFDASIVSDAGNPPTYYLTITHGTGEAKKFRSVVNGDGITDPNKDVTSDGKDAIVSVGANTFTSSTNSFSELVPDLIINLDPTISTDPAPTVRLKTASNTAQSKQVLLDIVDGYNNLLSIINAELKYDKDITKRGGLNNNSVARTFLWQMRELTTASIKVSTSRSVSLADVGISTNLDGTLSLDQNKLASVMSSRPGVLESVVSSNVVNGASVKGALQRILDMTDVIVAPKSSFNAIATQAEKVDLPKIELEVTKLDDAMTALQAKYLKQFSAMQSAVLSSKSTQDSLTQAMAGWSANLK